MTTKTNRRAIMVSGRACEIHCLFLVVVAILIAVQLFLQNTQKQIDDSKSKTSESEVHLEKRDISSSENKELFEEEVPVAAPIVPNIHKSFLKKKAPYVRKGKKNRKNKKNNKKDVGAKLGKGIGKKGNDHGAKKGGINQEKKLKGIRNDPNKIHGKSSNIHVKK